MIKSRRMQVMISLILSVLVQALNGLILIAKRKAGDKLANKWEFPGGKIEAGKSPEECLRREMKEEFQIVQHQKSLMAFALRLADN